MMLVVRKKYF